MQNKIIYCCQSDNQLGLHPDSTRLCNAINHVLPVNEIQMLIVEKVFHSLNRIPAFNYDWIKDQLLLYICGKGGVRMNRIVYAIELGYALLS